MNLRFCDFAPADFAAVFAAPSSPHAVCCRLRRGRTPWIGRLLAVTHPPWSLLSLACAHNDRFYSRPSFAREVGRPSQPLYAITAVVRPIAVGTRCALPQCV